MPIESVIRALLETGTVVETLIVSLSFLAWALIQAWFSGRSLKAILNHLDLIAKIVWGVLFFPALFYFSSTTDDPVVFLGGLITGSVVLLFAFSNISVQGEKLPRE